MKPRLLQILGTILIAASGLMYVIGSNDSKLTELKDTFFLPLIPGVLLLAASLIKKKEN